MTKEEIELGRLIVTKTHSRKAISVSDVDLQNGSPKIGDMIARNPKNHNDQWLVADKFPEKFDWFARQEQQGYKSRTFKNGITYDRIRSAPLATSLDFDDFTDCDSGYCGL